MKKAIGVSWPARDHFSRYQRFAGGVRLGHGIIPRIVHLRALAGLDLDEQFLRGE
jgi:hypothetical protein